MIKIFASHQLQPGTEYSPGPYNLHHLKVMRVLPGDEILIGDSSEKELVARIKDNFSAEIIKESSRHAAPARKITLFAALLKKQKYEDLIFKCSQIGINEIYPVVTSRTIKTLKKNSMEKVYERWNKKARHGAELSMREKIPSIECPVEFADALKIYKSKRFDNGIFLYEEEKKERYIKQSDLKNYMALFVGPEGGFTSAEAAAAAETGLLTRTLGKLVFDSEVACISAAAVLLCRND